MSRSDLWTAVRFASVQLPASLPALPRLQSPGGGTKVNRGHLIGGAIAALVVATTAAAAQIAPPPGVAQGTAPAPMPPRAPLPPVAPLPPMVAPPMTMMMMHSDHAMSRDEVVKHVRELFARLDTNHDGFITKNEVEAFHQKFAGMAQMGHDMGERAHGMAEMGQEMAERYSDGGMPMRM